MSDTYKVRMTVLVMFSDNSPEDARQWARHLAEEAGFHVLRIEDPEVAVTRPVSDSVEGDIYP